MAPPGMDAAQQVGCPILAPSRFLFVLPGIACSSVLFFLGVRETIEKTEARRACVTVVLYIAAALCVLLWLR